MVHIKQQYSVSCGAAAYASIVGCSETQAIRECKTGRGGTSVVNIKLALDKRGIKHYGIRCDYEYNYLRPFLRFLSNEYKIFINGEFRSNSGRGRDRVRRHAFAIWKEEIYDPSEVDRLDMSANGHTYSKRLDIKEVILIGFDAKSD